MFTRVRQLKCKLEKKNIDAVLLMHFEFAAMNYDTLCCVLNHFSVSCPQHDGLNRERIKFLTKPALTKLIFFVAYRFI